MRPLGAPTTAPTVDATSLFPELTTVVSAVAARVVLIENWAGFRRWSLWNSRFVINHDLLSLFT